MIVDDKNGFIYSLHCIFAEYGCGYKYIYLAIISWSYFSYSYHVFEHPIHIPISF